MPSEPGFKEDFWCWFNPSGSRCNELRENRHLGELYEIQRRQIQAEQRAEAAAAQRGYQQEISRLTSQQMLSTMTYLLPIVAVIGGGMALILWWNSKRLREGKYSGVSTAELQAMAAK